MVEIGSCSCFESRLVDGRLCSACLIERIGDALIGAIHGAQSFAVEGKPIRVPLADMNALEEAIVALVRFRMEDGN